MRPRVSKNFRALAMVMIASALTASVTSCVDPHHASQQAAEYFATIQIPDMLNRAIDQGTLPGMRKGRSVDLAEIKKSFQRPSEAVFTGGHMALLSSEVDEHSGRATFDVVVMAIAHVAWEREPPPEARTCAEVTVALGPPRSIASELVPCPPSAPTDWYDIPDNLLPFED